MKNNTFSNTIASAVLVASFALLAACGSSPRATAAPAPAPAPPPPSPPAAAVDELDAAIQEASDYLNRNIPKGNKAVFLNIRSDYPDLSEYILSGISENAVNSRVFSVVDRRELDTIRSELDFQYSGEVSDDSAQAIGRMLGAQTIVSGTAGKFGTLYRIQIKAIEVQSASVQGQWNKNVSGGATIAALTARHVPASAAAPVQRSGGTTQTAQAQAPAAPTAAAPTPAAPVEPPKPVVYKVGDKGPAGGIVFYDKGNDSGGWRYLEAAPAGNEFKARWGGNFFVSTKEELGSGKANTQANIDAHNQKGVISRAARYCAELNINGYADWFFPSKAELNWMYMNLKEKGLGGFTSDWYWSSSQTEFNGIAWAQNFGNGNQTSNHIKDNTCSVRAVRAF